MTQDLIDANADWLSPVFVDPTDGRLRMSFHSFVLRTPRHTILVDAGRAVFVSSDHKIEPGVFLEPALRGPDWIEQQWQISRLAARDAERRAAACVARVTIPLPSTTCGKRAIGAG